MSDYSELKRLAEAATPGPWAYDGSYVCPARTEDGTTYVELWRSIADCHQSENTKFIAAANPAAVLALIAEVESLREHKQLLVDLREADGYESWASVLVMVDKLKAENERLKAESEQAKQHDVPAESLVQYRHKSKEGYSLPGIASHYGTYCMALDSIVVTLPKSIEAYGCHGHHSSDPDEALILEDVHAALTAAGVKYK